MASISSRRPRAATIAAISSMGFKMPEVVSQCTATTWLMAGSSAKAVSSASRSGGVSSGVSWITSSRPR